MRWNTLIIPALAALLIGALTSGIRADDLQRLDLRPAGQAGVLGLDNDDNLLVRGFYRSYSGYRSYYAPRAYYRPSVSFYYSGPTISFSYARPYAYSYYYAPPVYYTPPAYYYYPSYYCPISDSAAVMPYAASTGARTTYTIIKPVPEPAAASAPLPSAPAAPTYPYDGGPQNPVPLPAAKPAQAVPPTVPLEGRAVSLPREEKKYTYPAYGEARPAFAQDRVVPVSTPASR